jgi:hypothetical protein
MLQFERAYGKNMIAKAKGKQAKVAKKQDKLK